MTINNIPATATVSGWGGGEGASYLTNNSSIEHSLPSCIIDLIVDIELSIHFFQH